MNGQILQILFKDDLAFLTEEVALDFNQVQISYTPVKFKAPAFWTVRVLNYNPQQQKLYVEVLSYQVGETTFSANQIALTDQLLLIEKVTFKSIDTAGLFRTLNSKTPLRILAPKPAAFYMPETPPQAESTVAKESIEQTIHEYFSIPIKEVTFLAGKVVFEKRISPIKNRVAFEIWNEHILQSYDAVKNYIAGVLKTKRLQVHATVVTADGELISASAVSTDLDRITSSFIEELKMELVKTARRSELPGDHRLFTLQTYLDHFTGGELNAFGFFKNEEDLLDQLLERSGTKHYHQLRFFSAKHRGDIQKLRILHKPLSFLFLIKGSTCYHSVWETLDTQEATYIWTTETGETNLRKVLAKTEQTIRRILEHGKNEYILQKEPGFHRVFHDYTDAENGFKNWKAEMEKIIG